MPKVVSYPILSRLVFDYRDNDRRSCDQSHDMGCMNYMNIMSAET